MSSNYPKPLLSGLLTFLIFAPLFSCKDKKTEPADICENALCQDIFKFATITLKDQNGQPYPLDNYYTIKLSTGKEIKFLGREIELDSLRRSRGRYPVLSDNEMDLTNTEGVDFEFHGFLKGKEIVKENYKINHNCCNVNILSGPTEIIISE